MKDITKYQGVIPAFYACYDAEGNISTEGVKALTRHLIAKGVKGVYVGGSSGECIYQHVDERKAVLEAVMSEAKGKLTVIAHVGCNNTADSVELARHAESVGVDAIASIPPIYFHLPEYAIAKYWNDMSAAAPNTEFVIYNIPQLAGTGLTMSGAVGIRANTVRDITQIKEVVDLPVIGIIKKDYPGTPMYITVTMKEVDELVACGVDILAVQGTGALRPDGSTSAEFIRAIKAKYPDQLVMADCDNFENAMACAEAGADFVGTTMRGYTPETQGIDDIDFDFVHKLATECPAKVIAEGHIHYPEQAVKALEAGAFALVVGGAITRPAEITARFTGAINAMNK